ncbi:MAG: ROK family protein [Planctomycetota bacterium]|jgi:glucokinase
MRTRLAHLPAVFEYDQVAVSRSEVSMTADQGPEQVRRYVGVDVGGTKIQASLVEESGRILRRQRSSTPRDGGSEQVVEAIEEAMEEVLRKEQLDWKDLTAIGMAIPGVVDPDAGLVVVTPNMNLTGVSIGPHLEGHCQVPVAVGNDCNLGTLGETWLGSARGTRSAVGILVGTGIGSGIVEEGKLWRGARESAAEIGHIVMQIGGPKCGCGNRGCFEALASRTAIERDLREAIASGKKSVIEEILEGDLGVIRSGALRDALEAEDELVTDVIRRAAEVLGHACLTVRHLIDPEVIVLGGGVIEACGQFMVPIVDQIVTSDQLPGAREGGRVLVSALGDDAVVLGAVALARRHVRRSPFRAEYDVAPSYPQIVDVRFGQVTIGQETYSRDVVIRVDGKVRKRKKSLAKKAYGTSHVVGPEELARVCRGGPEALFIGTGHSGLVEVSAEARRFLSQRSIECCAVPTPELMEAYNDFPKRKAALIHVTC